MRILLVEDNEAKRRQLASLILKTCNVEPEVAVSISSAYSVVEHNTPKLSLVVLDMTFHSNFDRQSSAKKQALAGVQLLQFMQSLGLSVPVIVATQHTEFSDPAINISSIQELEELLSEEFPELFRGLVQVDLGSEDWHRVFVGAVKGTLNG